MGYLVCKKCKGFYELQEGESPDDYIKCHCGGVIQYYESLEEYKEHKKNPKENSLPFHCPDPDCSYLTKMESGDKCPKCGKTAQGMPLEEAVRLYNKKLSKNKNKQTTPNKPRSSSGASSKGKKSNWFNKQNGGTKTALGLGICCIGVILIIGVGGMLSDITTSYITFTGTAMSFKYPSDWKVFSVSSTGNSVTLNKGEGGQYKELYVEIMGSSVQAETAAMISEGFYYDDKSASGTQYREFNEKKGTAVTVLLFEKNGKVFEITGDPLDTGVMEKIVTTIN